MSKVPVNRNFIWTEAFINQLAELGVRYACISPGSRSAPLTVSFSRQRRIKCYIHTDERVSGFFALGLAKATNLPVAVVTTSGTATAELHPAIIEAYQQRIPLIICTADRPPELLNTGANQTINQWNLYRNHIRWFKNIGLPDTSVNRITALKKTAVKAFEVSLKEKKGPVHLNFPFRKPLEPTSFTDEIDAELLEQIKNLLLVKNEIKDENDITKKDERQVKKVTERIIRKDRGLIIIGPMNYDKEFIRNVKKLSKVTGYPILADGVSQLRFNASKSDKNICVNYDSFLRSDKFIENHQPEIVLHFGRVLTSVVIEDYLKRFNPIHFIINEYGDLFDPLRKSKAPIKVNPIQFCKKLIQTLNENNLFKQKSELLEDFEKADALTEKIKTIALTNSDIQIEPKIISEIISIVPSNTKIMVGNSLPVRDFDCFVGKTTRNLKIYFNRGASGIDGITSTTLGIASVEKPVVLITGDLSFIHDLNGLIAARKYSIPLVIILINNNGGGIFDLLPIASTQKAFTKYFKTPHNLNIAQIVKSFGLNHYLIKSSKDFQKKLSSSLQEKSFSVLEVVTDSMLSNKMRKKFRSNTIKKIDKEFKAK